MAGDAGAQVRIGDAPLDVAADISLGDLVQAAQVGAAEGSAPRIAALSVALELQQALSDGPATMERTHQILFGDLHVGEEGLAERRVAADQTDRPRLDSRRLHVDQEKGNAFVLARVVGADQAETPIGILRTRGPDLLAVDEEVIALVDRLRAQA